MECRQLAVCSGAHTITLSCSAPIVSANKECCRVLPPFACPVRVSRPCPRLCLAQKALLEEVAGSSTPLRSLRQLGWDLGPQETLALFHEQLSDVAGTNVQMVPMVTQSMFQSAADLVQVVKEFVEDGKGLPRVEQLMLTVRERKSLGSPRATLALLVALTRHRHALRDAVHWQAVGHVGGHRSAVGSLQLLLPAHTLPAVTHSCIKSSCSLPHTQEHLRRTLPECMTLPCVACTIPP